MSDHPYRLTDDLITQVLRARSSDPDVSLLDDIVRTAAATPQRRRWLGLGPMRLSRRTLLIVAIALLLVTTGAIAIGSRLIRPPDELPPVVGQIVDAINGRDEGALRAHLGADAIVVLPHLRMDGRYETNDDWKVSPGFVHGWMLVVAAFDMEADLGQCRAVTASTIRCDVRTRWHALQVEIGEEWTFVLDEGGLTRLEMARVDPNPTNRSLPLGYDDLRSWELWLEVTHPDQAAALEVAGNNLIWTFYFHYHHSYADAIGASIQEYLGSHLAGDSPVGTYVCSEPGIPDVTELWNVREDGTITLASGETGEVLTTARWSLDNDGRVVVIDDGAITWFSFQGDRIFTGSWSCTRGS